MNYPPNVSGLEYEFAGPDRQGPESAWCRFCGTDTDGVVSVYQDQPWYTCGACGEDQPLDPPLTEIKEELC